MSLNIEALLKSDEAAVLSAVLCNPSRWHDAAGILSEKMFGERVNRLVWSAMAALVADGVPLQPSTVSGRLQTTPEAAEMLGELRAYVYGLIDLAASPATIQYNAQLIREEAQKKAVESAAGHLGDLAKQPATSIEDLQAVASKLSDQLTTAAQARERHTGLLRDLISPAFDVFASRANPKAAEEIEWPANWAGPLRELYGNGLRPGLHVLVGDTGSGKTQLALQLALDAATPGTEQEEDHQHPVLFIALEADAGATDVVARLTALSRVGLPKWSDIYKGRRYDKANKTWNPLTDEQLRKCRETAQGLAELPFTVARLDKLTHESVVRCVSSWASGDYAGPVRLVVLDYLQMIRGTAENRREVIGLVSGRLRRLAADHNLAILCLSSTSRDKYHVLSTKDEPSRTQGKTAPKRPDVQAIGTGDITRLVGMGKESGEIEYDADSVLVICKHTKENGPATTYVAVAKQRAGEKGWADIQFNGARWGLLKGGV